MEKFSVLMSVYCGERSNCLSLSLQSVFNQTIMPDEVILVKDGSLTRELEDSIQIYVEKYPRLKVVSLSVNQGLGRALNLGIKYCSNDIIARMDTDDVARSDRFAKQIAVFEKYPDIDVVSAWIDEFDGQISNVVSTRKLPELHNDIYMYAKKRCPVNHPVVMFKKKAVIAAGGYKHFPLFEDYYLWVRMLMNGAKFYNIQEALLSFRFSTEMFGRRGGVRYAINELRLQREFAKMGFISSYELFRNVMIRFTSRLIPNKLREIVYLKLLR